MFERQGINDEAVLEDRPSGLFRVHRGVYTDPALLEREQQLIFERCWIYVGHETEVPKAGDFITRRVAGRPVIMVRGADGKIRVLLNTCTHRGAMVCREAAGSANTFQCFYHAWTFDNRGNLVGVPGEDAYGPGFKRGNLKLYEPRTEGYRGLIFMCLNRDSENLIEYLAGAREYIDLILDQSDENGLEIVRGSHQYCLQANWKMLMENTMDGYHFLATHQRLFLYIRDVMQLPTDGRQALDTGYAAELGNGHAVLEARRFVTSFDEAKRKQWENRYGKERAAKMLENNRQLMIFPSFLMIEIFQAIRTCTPLTSGRMEVGAWALMPKSDPPELRKQRLQYYLAFLGPGGCGTPDDIEAMELCQRGYAAQPDSWSEDSRGMMREVPHADDELQMRAFWKRWRELLAV